MKCPHCRDNFHEEVSELGLGADVDGDWQVVLCQCPSCKKFVVKLERLEREASPLHQWVVAESRLVRPKGTLRPPAPSEVSPNLAEDYTEACLVLADSPKASAALSRRCLQGILREKAKVKPSSLAMEIQEVLDSNQLPSYLADDIDAVRNTGNFAAHPINSQNTGAIVPVEAGEAEWNLDVIESLFDFYYVAPAKAQARRDALNKKLTDAGKPPMKAQ